MFAAQNGHEDIAQMLVSYSNCDILAKDGVRLDTLTEIING